jgi:transcriptional regulator with XRE-family HTH domain
MSIAADLVSSARRYHGLSGRSLARAAHASQAGLVDLENGAKDATTARLDRLLRPLGYQLAVLPTRLGTASAAALEIHSFLAARDDAGALRVVWQLASDLQSAEPALRVALCITPPASTGDARFDALLAGIVDHLLDNDDLPRPSWLSEPWRTLVEPWDVEPVPTLRARARQVTPPTLVSHGVYLDPAELVNH